MDGQRRQPGPGERPGGDGSGTGQPDLPANLRRRRSWGPSAWAPASSSFAPVRRPAAPRERRFAPTQHLAPEAVAAFVDGELGMTAQMRATHHLAMCHECVAAVDAQAAARTRLRSSGTMAIPSGLLGQLSQIPTREFDMSAEGAPALDERRPGRPDAAHNPGAHNPGAHNPSTGHRGGPPMSPSGEAVSVPAPPMTRGRIQRWRSR